MPPDLREMQDSLSELEEQMEAASQRQDFEEAMRLKQEKLVAEEEFEQKRADWFASHNIDESVDEEDVADVVAKWTGIPVKRMVQEEMTRLLDMKVSLSARFGVWSIGRP